MPPHRRDDAIELTGELARINSEQADLLRHARKELAVAVRRDSHLYQELSRLNNELVTAQRATAKQNAELVRLNEELRTLATTDSLTGAYNRRRFVERAQEEIAAAQRYDRPLSLLLIDVDDFKSVNDRFGHIAGDEVLRLIVRHCRETLRASDVFGRIGGDEFAALLVEASADQAQAAVRRLCRRLARETEGREDGLPPVTLSIGLATSSRGEASLEEMIRQADKELYAAKREGGADPARIEPGGGRG